EMLVWGGRQNDVGVGILGDGGRYRPETDSWTKISSSGAPSPRYDFASVWTGSEWLIWGGGEHDPNGNARAVRSLGDGAAYDPTTDSWRTISLIGAPSPRQDPVAVWTGREMVVWGGRGADFVSTIAGGARYNPVTDT